MAFVKGIGGNPNGRPIGAKNKTNKRDVINAFSEYIIEGGAEKFKEELNKLKGKSFITAYLMLVNYSNKDINYIDVNNILTNKYIKNHGINK